MRVIEIEKQYTADIRIHVKDESMAVYTNAIERCVDNHNDEGVPVSEGGWRDNFYNLDTPEKVQDMWTYNAVSNNVYDLCQLDGWADIAPGEITFTFDLTEW